MKRILFILAVSILPFTAAMGQRMQDGGREAGFGILNNTKVDGFRGIWYDLHQRQDDYGSKYIGSFATYTVKHRPLAVYCKEVDKTFFVYGGTTQADERHLLCMISCYDHKTGMVKKPTVVYDKGPVNDPHDNPAILIDPQGYIWVFVAGRMNYRVGFRYRSVRPYDIDEFQQMGEGSIMVYPQPMYVDGKGFFLFETRYDGLRQLFWQTSSDGVNWSEYHQLANIRYGNETRSGQYQVTAQQGERLVTAFNRHINGNVNQRTNIYYLETRDMGEHWTLVDGTPIDVPIVDKDSPCKIIDFEHNGQNCYIKDLNFDKDGNPIILFVSSYGSHPGPECGPREWGVAHWTGKKWDFRYITQSTHNYDSGAIYVTGKEWKVIGPTEPGPQYWQQGGEVASWVSRNNGKKWKMENLYTQNSPFNHCYVRRPLDAKNPFYCFWSAGNAEVLTKCYLYFGDSEGNVWRMPYDMTEEWAAPEKMRFYTDEECTRPIPKDPTKVIPFG